MGNSLKNQSQFPGQIVGVGDAHVGPKGSCRRSNMSCVANQEDIAMLERGGGPDGDLPGIDIVDLDGQVGDTHSSTYQLNPAFSGKILDLLALVREIGSEQCESLAVTGEDKGCSPSYLWVVYKTDNQPPATQWTR